MKVIAKMTDSFLIQATENEWKELITSVTGKRPEKIEIGQIIPAIELTNNISKIKALAERADKVYKQIQSISEKVNNYYSTES